MLLGLALFLTPDRVESRLWLVEMPEGVEFTRRLRIAGG